MRIAIGAVTDSQAAPSGVTSLEGALIDRAASGDARAFRALYDRHAPPLYRFLCDLLRDRAAADEALQETFVRAHARLSSLREHEKLRAWLFGIARLVVMEQRRARKTEQLDEDTVSAEPTHSPTPEAQLLTREAGRALGAALADLRPQRREALLLQADHELPYETIAEHMGWSLAKVKVEIHRARRELRALMSKHLGLGKGAGGQS